MRIEQCWLLGDERATHWQIKIERNNGKKWGGIAAFFSTRELKERSNILTYNYKLGVGGLKFAGEINAYRLAIWLFAKQHEKLFANKVVYSYTFIWILLHGCYAIVIVTTLLCNSTQVVNGVEGCSAWVRRRHLLTQFQQMCIET